MRSLLLLHHNPHSCNEMRKITLAALAAFLLAAPAAGQNGGSDGLTGTRVRVTAPQFLPERLTGTVLAYTREGLLVRDEASGDSVRLPLRAVSRLDKFAGGSAASTAWYRGRVGAFVGGGLGAIAGPLLARVTGKGMGESALLGGAIGLGTGFTVGAVYGAASPRERWTWTLQPWGYDPALRP